MSVFAGDIMQAKEISLMSVTRFPGHTRAFLKIQDGCDSFCSYCIIPYARGPSRSLPEAEVIKNIVKLNQAGHHEVVLTGIHLGNYGHDLTPQTNLLRVLEAVERQKNVERLRLSSIEVTEISDDLITFMAESKTLCRHLHIPLQSGDSRILALMRRNYDAPFVKSLLYKLHKTAPDIGIGMDVMVGFPGEDEVAFENTRQLIEELPVSYLHVFPYSERPGTRAVDLPGKVEDRDKKRRAEILRTIGKKKRQAFAQLFIGKELSVLVEGEKKNDQDWNKGFSSNYIPVMIERSRVPAANTIVRVVPEFVREGKLYTRHIIREQ
ncbi:MAG: MiaB/RimO family radical SAM methylthiotransferase [Deltaproteobacteria bacterium]|nr:MiaB/RimO family radical SAM methylthiotransferase [Deltaproteobacteria bacterium]